MKNKGHHYITESYQKLFADNKGQITVLTPIGKIFSTNPDNTFKEDHFNTVKMPDGKGTLIVEKTLEQIECAFIPVILEKVHKTKSLEENDKIHIAMFVAAMFNRTKVQREHMRQTFSNLKHTMEEWREQFKTLSLEHRRSLAATPRGDRPTISIEELEEGLKDFDSHQAVSVLSGVEDITPKLLEMHWLLLEAPEGKEFLSSDNPLCMCSPSRELKYPRGAIGAIAGLDHSDVEVTFPLSKRFALVATWKNHSNEYGTATPKMVDQINYRSIRAADNIFSNNKTLLENILLKSPN